MYFKTHLICKKCKMKIWAKDDTTAKRKLKIHQEYSCNKRK